MFPLSTYLKVVGNEMAIEFKVIGKEVGSNRSGIEEQETGVFQLHQWRYTKARC